MGLGRIQFSRSVLVVKQNVEWLMIKRWTGRKGEGGRKLKVNRLTVEWRMGRDQDERASGLAEWLVVVVGC